MKIYTRTGDSGQTGLVGGSRVSKDCARITAVGEVDELNACIGLGASLESSFADDLLRIQNWLFELGAELASPKGITIPTMCLSPESVEWLEQSIDSQTANLAPLKHFILPGGSELGARLHLARCVCRRAERATILFGREERVREEALRFLNRLSDWLFVAARTANRLANVEDVKWEGLKR